MKRTERLTQCSKPVDEDDDQESDNESGAATLEGIDDDSDDDDWDTIGHRPRSNGKTRNPNPTHKTTREKSKSSSNLREEIVHNEKERDENKFV